MNRLNCSGLSGFGADLRGMGALYAHTAQSSNSGNSSCRGSANSRSERDRVVDSVLATSCLIGEPLALCADHGAGRPLCIIDPELGARVVPEIKLREIPIKVFL